MWEKIFFRSLCTKRNYLDFFSHVGLCDYCFNLEHGNTYSTKGTDILDTNIQRNIFRVESDIFTEIFCRLENFADYVAKEVGTDSYKPRFSYNWYIEILWLIIVTLVRIVMDHEYHQGDRSLSTKLHLSNSERLDTWAILNSIWMKVIFWKEKEATGKYFSSKKQLH